MLALRCAGVRAASLSRGRAGLRRFLSTARSAAGINVPSCCGHDHDGDDGDDDDAAATVAVDSTGLEYHVRKILEHLGEDPGRSGLVKTPLRVAKSLRFLTQGMHVANPSEALGDAVFAETLSDEMVLVRDIEVHSMCEHHMLPFMGRVHVAYVPNGRVVGLSKLARLTEVFARRLQVQERLTAQIADALMYDAQLAPRGVAVVMECTHMCMVMRGVEKAAATTLTSCMLGEFKDDASLRSELLAMIALPALGTRGSGIGRSGGGGGGRSSHTAARRMQLEEEVGDVRLPTSGLAAPSGVGSAGLSVTPGSGGGGFRGDADDDRVTISLCKQDMKFSAGHFTIFNGGARERLHGHNFAVSAEIVSRHHASSSNSSGGGGSSGAAGGLVLDYKVLKRALRDLCDDWDEVLLLPAASPHLRVEQVQQKLGAGRAAGGGGGDRVRVVFGPGAGRPQLADAEPGSSDVSPSSLAAATAEEEEMVFGASDVVLLPVPNITGEALSQLLLSRFVERVGAGVLAAAGVETVRVGVSSGPGQTVTSSRSLAARLPPGRPGKQPAAAAHRAPGPGVVGAAAGRYFSSRAFSSTTAAATTAAVAATTTGAGADAAAGIAVVTGASSGIGRAVAETFAAAGWAVHNISRRPLDAPWAANHLADAADEGALRGAAAEVVDAVAQRAGAGADGARVCVAHCAGVHANDSLQSVADTAGTDELLRTLRVNVMAPALLSSLLLPAMGAGSSVVYVGSTLSEIGVAGRLGYTASKHAVVGLMRASVQDLFGSGVHCACVCPGFTDTPMLDQALEVQMGLEGERLREVRAAIEGMSSFGRLVRPQEVADLVAFVAENPALNGAVLHANLGQRQS